MHARTVAEALRAAARVAAASRAAAARAAARVGGLFAVCIVACGHPVPQHGVVDGPADSHCVGVTPATLGVCSTAANAAKPRWLHVTADNPYGGPLYGSSGDDDGCKADVIHSCS